MLRNEVGRQTKRVVICPHCVAIDLLLYAAGILERTASSKGKKKEEKRKGELREVGREGKKRLNAPSKDRLLLGPKPHRRLVGLNK